VSAPLVACGDDEPVDGRPTVPGRLEIGYAGEGGVFMPFSANGDVELEPGSQGGFHIPIQLEVDAEARAFLGERSRHERLARRVVDDRLVSAPIAFDVVWQAGAEGRFELTAPVFVFLCPTPIGVEVADRALQIRVSLGDPEVVSPLVATTTVTARCPQTNQREFCEQICRG